VPAILGIVLLFILGIPLMSMALTINIFSVLLQTGLALAIFGWLLGIPYAFIFRYRKGRWPTYE